MMLGFIYMVLTAKPISIRRLCLLYVVAWASARCLLSILRIEPAASLAVELATTIVLLVWVSPLVRILYDAIFGKHIPLEVFGTVSGRVKFTYGFVFVILSVVALETWPAGAQIIGSALIRVVACACVGGGGFMILIQALEKTTRSKKVRQSGLLASNQLHCCRIRALQIPTHPSAG